MRLIAILIASATTLAAIAACGGDDASDGATDSPSPATEAPARTPGPAVSFAERVTFFGSDPGDSLAAIAAGDFNADGVPDVALAAPFADGPGNGRPDAGEVYLFFGPFSAGAFSAGAFSAGDRDTLAGDHDVVIYGAREGDQLGRGVAAGDFNGDGVDDIALGAPFAGGDGLDQSGPGAVFIVAGSADLAAETDLADSAGVVTISGADPGDVAGIVLRAADVDDDGNDDLLVSAFQADGPDNERPDAGEVYLIRGGPGLGDVNLASDQPAATIVGAESGDRLGENLAVGDVNGDGVLDLLVVSTFADGQANERANTGETYVIPGPIPALVDIAREEQAATIVGIDPGDQLGHSIVAGDVNGDDIDDLLLGAVSADGPGNTQNVAGEVVLILGAADLPEVVDVAAGGTEALIYGAGTGHRLGRAVALGDLNGDRLSDLLFGEPKAPSADGTLETVGAIRLLYGGSRDYPSTASAADFTFYGLDEGDVLGDQVFGIPTLVVADMDGDGLDDVIVTAPAGDGPANQREGAGEAFIAFARRP